MKAIEAQIEERFPVWDALSKFFLDTELQPDDYKRIAKVLAASRFTENEIEEILICEVRPACRINLLVPAGEWIGFGEDWLREKIAPRIGEKIKLNFWFRLLRLRDYWMYGRKWNKVRKLIREIRTK